MTRILKSARRKLVYFADMFAYPLRLAHYVELVNPLWTRHTLQAKVVKVWDETKDARTITLRPGRGWRTHRAGQYLRVGASIEGMRHTRTYSISSAPNPHDACITITVKAIPDGRVSRHLVRDVKVGSYLPIGEPQGDFVLPDSMPVHPLFITAGSGITPVMSMLRHYRLEHETLPDIKHMHYAPHAFDVIFGSELEELNQEQEHYNLHRIYTRDLDEGRSAKHFSAEQLEQHCPDWRDREVWACGPATLLDALEAHWAAAGLSHRLHIERFRARLAPEPEAGGTNQIQFACSQKTTESDGATSILRAAEDAGLNPAHGCRMGICHGCDVRVTSGAVRDLRTGEITHPEGDNVQVCVSAAAGAIEVEL